MTTPRIEELRRIAIVLGVLTGLILALAFGAPPGMASGGDRKAGSWPKPAERCTTANRGTVKWVRDREMDVWVGWRCRCNIGAIVVCHWERIAISRQLRIRRLLPNGTWYIPAGWHRHLHLVVLPMRGGGYCGYWWPTWHYPR